MGISFNGSPPTVAQRQLRLAVRTQLSQAWIEEFWEPISKILETTAPPQPSREARAADELIDTFGVILAEAEIECGHKHVTAFTQAHTLKGRYRLALAECPLPAKFSEAQVAWARKRAMKYVKGVNFLARLTMCLNEILREQKLLPRLTEVCQ